MNTKITATCFCVNTPSSGSLQVVLAKVMNYYSDKIQYSNVLLQQILGKCGRICNSWLGVCVCVCVCGAE